eukprot:jgi/Chlat1/142/Chrsp1S03093
MGRRARPNRPPLPRQPPLQPCPSAQSTASANGEAAAAPARRGRKRKVEEAAEMQHDEAPSTSGFEPGALPIRGYFSAKYGPKRVAPDSSAPAINVASRQDLLEAESAAAEVHAGEREQLLSTYTAQFPKWMFQLRAGFSLLFNGFGSKRALLERFALECLNDATSVVIDGYAQDLTLKQVLAAISHAHPSSYSSHHADEPQCSTAQRPPMAANSIVYVLIHNIDGPALRSSTAQLALSRVASLPHIHLIASIDHVDIPTLWDKQVLSRFNWWWHHMPTFEPYKLETAHMKPLLATGKREDAQLESAAVVLASLTANSRKVFKVLAEYQLAQTSNYGLPFESLFRLCRAKCLVTSDAGLRSLMGECRDHHLVRTRRAEAGTEHLYVPMGKEALVQLVNEMQT